MCFQTVFASDVGIQSVEARVTGSDIAITQLPGTTVVEKAYDDSFLSVTGYAEDGVSDRTGYYKEYLEYNRLLKEKWIADGNKAEDYVMQNTENYYVANNEEEFCMAVAFQCKVIELAADINLGYKYLEANEIDSWGVVGENIAANKYLPISSPDLMEDGVSKINFSDINGMTIFSRNGSTVYHCEFNFYNCTDIVIRNIGMQGMNEWDDTERNANAGGNGAGGHKRYDWDFIALNECKNIWIDHCTLGIAYDGSIDVSGGSTATISWCVIGKPDEVLLEEMHRTMDYMEELYQKGEGHQFYTALRDGGATKEQIFEFSLLNDKVHAFSENDSEYDKNIYDRVTLAYNYYENSVQRVPQIRSGNAHMFNCWVNSDAYRKIHTELSDASIGKQIDGNGNSISPITYAARKGCSTLGLCRANSVLGGGTIGTDTCVFEGVINPIISTEVEESTIYNTGVLTGAVNHNLIVNSSTRDYGKEVYIGSSWDHNGENGFVSGSYWNGNKVSINDFKWAKWKDITKDSSKASDTVEYVPEKDSWAYGEFYQKYYIGQEKLEYEYQIVPLEDVKTTLSSHSGCGKVVLDEEQWLSAKYQTEQEKCKVSFQYDVVGVINPTILVEAGQTVGLLETMEKTGYTFDGWYTREYYLEEDEDETILLYNEIPFTEETVVTEDTCVYARWKVNMYKVYLELNGGTTTGPKFYECEYNSVFMFNRIDLSLISKDGYQLDGWYKDADLKKKLLYVSVADEDVTIYAKWKENAEEPSETPGVSDSPEPSATPDVSDSPEPSAAPDVSGSAQPSAAPDVSGSPEPSAAPDVSDKPQPSSNPNDIATGVKGDVTGNGKIELDDAQLVLKAALKIIKLEAEQEKMADYDQDNKVELDDAQMILKKALKII